MGGQEAYLKGKGVGLSLGLDRVDVVFDGMSPVATVRWTDSGTIDQPWTIQSLRFLIIWRARSPSKAMRGSCITTSRRPIRSTDPTSCTASLLSSAKNPAADSGSFRTHPTDDVHTMVQSGFRGMFMMDPQAPAFGSGAPGRPDAEYEPGRSRRCTYRAGFEGDVQRAVDEGASLRLLAASRMVKHFRMRGGVLIGFTEIVGPRR